MKLTVMLIVGGTAGVYYVAGQVEGGSQVRGRGGTRNYEADGILRRHVLLRRVEGRETYGIFIFILYLLSFS